jgi:hypothetical protein
MKKVGVACHPKRCKLKDRCCRYSESKWDDDFRYDKNTCYWFADKKEYEMREL